MYEREKTLQLKTSASLQPNNLSRVRIDGKVYAGVVHRDEVNIVSAGSHEMDTKVVIAKSAASASAGVTIMQASWAEMGEQVFLVLATTVGVFVYDWDGAVLLHAHLLPQPPTDAPYAFTRGIAALSTGHICVGVHTGEILVIDAGAEGGMGVAEKVRWHARPIAALAAHGPLLASGDDGGDIAIARDDEEGLAKACAIDSYGFPVTCLAIWEGYVIAGYLTGHLRIFSHGNGQIVAEVCGHVRCVMGLHVARETGLLLTTSEDTFARVWRLSPRPELPIEHKYCRVEENAALCGGVFADDLGSGYFVAGYDRRDLLCYAM